MIAAIAMILWVVARPAIPAVPPDDAEPKILLKAGQELAPAVATRITELNAGERHIEWRIGKVDVKRTDSVTTPYRLVIVLDVTMSTDDPSDPNVGTITMEIQPNGGKWRCEKAELDAKMKTGGRKTDWTRTVRSALERP